MTDRTEERSVTADEAAYDDVRRRLVEHGYLQSPVERFVLRDLPVRGLSALGAISRAALRAAVVGGPVLGAVLAATAAMANRPLRSLVDPLVLWAYFTPLAAAALFLLDIGATLLVVRPLRHRGAKPADALRVATLVALPVLAYLLLLWRQRRPDSGLLENLAFLAAALLATLLIARLAGIVGLAGMIRRTGQIPARGRRLLVLALLALPLAVLFLVLPDVAQEPPAGLVPFEGDPQRGRTLVIGIDGLDRRLLDQLDSPGLAIRLAAAAQHPIRGEPHLEPPAAWTTLMSGMSPQRHGVTSVGLEKLPGVATPLKPRSGSTPLAAALRFLLPARTVPSSGAGRTVPTLWEIAASHHPSVAVGWWNSWPAGDDGQGYLVTERLLPKLLVGAEPYRDTWPATLHDRLADEFPEASQRIRNRFDAELGPIPQELREPMLESFLIDRYHWEVALRLFSDPATRSAFVYLPGLDILRARLEGQDQAQAASLAYASRLGDRISADLHELDLDQLVIIGDPGRSAAVGTEGWLAMECEGCVPGCLGTAIDRLAVAPSLLARLGFPASLELNEQARGCVKGAAGHSGELATFGERVLSDAPQEREFDPEMVERLRSLGYLR